MNGRPDIDDTGASVKAQGGQGYAPPGPGLEWPRMGRFGRDPIVNPYEYQDSGFDDESPD